MEPLPVRPDPDPARRAFEATPWDRGLMGTLNDRGELDPTIGTIITCLGKKRSGKSVMAKLFLSSYPYDAVVIDPNGTDGPFENTIPLHGDVSSLPAKWPEELRKEDQRMVLRYVPDMGSPTVTEDMDAVVGMAYRTERVAILVHEMGLLARANRTPPHTLRVLQSNRHRKITAIFCAPRPITMDPLVLAQSDLVYVFEMPNEADRARVAGTCGWDRKDFDAAVHELGRHEYLRFDANEDKPETEEEPDLRLVHFPALPEDVVRQVSK